MIYEIKDDIKISRNRGKDVNREELLNLIENLLIDGKLFIVIKDNIKYHNSLLNKIRSMYSLEKSQIRISIKTIRIEKGIKVLRVFRIR